jgi:hypothetical protein
MQLQPRQQDTPVTQGGTPASVTEVVTVDSAVWVVAQIKATNAQGWATDWDLGGVFTSEQRAREACTEPTDAMWPVPLDVPLGRETIAPPGITYPAAPGQE